MPSKGFYISAIAAIMLRNGTKNISINPNKDIPVIGNVLPDWEISGSYPIVLGTILITSSLSGNNSSKVLFGGIAGLIAESVYDAVREKSIEEKVVDNPRLISAENIEKLRNVMVSRKIIERYVDKLLAQDTEGILNRDGFIADYLKYEGMALQEMFRLLSNDSSNKFKDISEISFYREILGK